MKRKLRLSLSLAVAGLLLAAGCAAPGPKQLVICPGKANVDEALAALGARAERAVPLRASGQCVLDYYDPEDDKQERHKVSLLLWFDPPSRLYIQGSIGVDNKAVIVGCNDEEFWLALKPKEVSAYYWGRWADADNVEGLIINPRLVLEAFGIIVRPDAGAGSGLWSLENEGPYDILTLRNEEGELREKVHIYACDYLVHKTEYFDPEGKLIATAELEDYRPLVEGFDVPRTIRVTTVAPEGHTDSVDVRLSSWKQTELSDPAKERYFNRHPEDMDQFENVYRYEDGEWLREK
ncbi:MAG: hypothetical protein JW993_07815 [Sedimentisphaerales bacterium]|nr:hypothetical protein [Sedimentisphaerales bacterium]